MSSQLKIAVYRFREYVVSEKHIFNDTSDAFCGVTSTAIAYTPDVPKVIDLMIAEREIIDARIVTGFDVGGKRLVYSVQGRITMYKDLA